MQNKLFITVFVCCLVFSSTCSPKGKFIPDISPSTKLTKPWSERIAAAWTTFKSYLPSKPSWLQTEKEIIVKRVKSIGDLIAKKPTLQEQIQHMQNLESKANQFKNAKIVNRNREAFSILKEKYKITIPTILLHWDTTKNILIHSTTKDNFEQITQAIAKSLTTPIKQITYLESSKKTPSIQKQINILSFLAIDLPSAHRVIQKMQKDQPSTSLAQLFNALPAKTQSPS